jgi:hypothetical protein
MKLSSVFAAVREETFSFGRHVKRVVTSTGARVAGVVGAAAGAVGLASEPVQAAATWPTGMDPTTISGLFTTYIYDAIPVVVGITAIFTGVWFVIHSIHGVVTRRG